MDHASPSLLADLGGAVNFQIGDIVWNMHTRSVAQIASELKTVQLPDGMIVSAHKLQLVDGVTANNWCGRPSDMCKVEKHQASSWGAVKVHTGWNPPRALK